MARLPKIPVRVISRLKWLLWLWRAYALLKSIKEVINFIDATHLAMQELRAELDKICKEGEDEGG